MFSPYMGFGNNPINITDPDGKLLRDTDGNLIVVESGKTQTKGVKVGYTDNTKKTPVFATVTYKVVYIFANDGTPIKALMQEGDITLYTNKNNTKKSLDKNFEAEVRKSIDLSSNCHGISVANGQLWIDAQEGLDDAFLKESEFETTDESNADIAIFKSGKGGGIVKHSALKTDKEYITKNGHQKSRVVNSVLEAGQRLYGKYSFKKEKKNKSNWAGGDTKSKSGLRIYKSANEVKKANPTDSKKLKL